MSWIIVYITVYRLFTFSITVIIITVIKWNKYYIKVINVLLTKEKRIIGRGLFYYWFGLRYWWQTQYSIGQEKYWTHQHIYSNRGSILLYQDSRGKSNCQLGYRKRRRTSLRFYSIRTTEHYLNFRNYTNRRFILNHRSYNNYYYQKTRLQFSFGRT